MYENEAEVGKALTDKMASGDVKREELFITSKVYFPMLNANTFFYLNIFPLKIALEHFTSPKISGKSPKEILKSLGIALFGSVPHSQSNFIICIRC